MKQVLEKLRDLGFEKPRAAVSLLALAFFGLLYLMVAFNGPPGWGPAFGGLSACYFTAFFALSCDWFWGRWFASGLGWSGMMVGIASLVMVGWHPVLALYGGLHAMIVGALMGTKMAARYDLQPGWRERFGMDEFGVLRLRKAVTRAAAALPSLILWALGPREGQGVTLLVAALGLTTLGMHAILRLRTWGLVALAGGAAAAAAVIAAPLYHVHGAAFLALPVAMVPTPGTLAAVSLVILAATLPFAGPAVRFLRGR